MNIKGVSEENHCFLQHHPLSIPGGRKQDVMSQESDRGWQIRLYHGKKQILHCEMTSSLIAWDLSPAVVNRDWFTSQEAFSDSKIWFKFAILDLCRRHLKVLWLYVTPSFKVTQQRISPESANLTFSPGNFHFNRSYLGKPPWCWGL